MRGLAAVLVFALHAPSYFGDLTHNDIYLAVDLFFVLSGFVLAHAYGQQMDEGMSPWRFMAVRLVRLYPLYIAGLALGLVTEVIALRAGHAAMAPGQIAMAGALGAAMLPMAGARYDLLYPTNLPCWSLLFELLANFAMALAWRRLSNRTLATIIGVSLIGLVWVIFTQSGPGGSSGANGGFTWSTFMTGVFRVGFSFFLGILIYRKRDLVKISLSPWLALGVVAFALMIELPDRLRTWYDLACIVVVFPTVIALAVQTEPAVGARVFRFVGLTSYAVYVLHYPIQRLVRGFVLKVFHQDVASYAPWSGVGLAVFMLWLCWTVDKLYDTPVRSWLAARLKGWKPVRDGRRLIAQEAHDLAARVRRLSLVDDIAGRGPSPVAVEEEVQG
jgi:peptidoglycan/LPS O-acetylase OafA/YrhL